MSFPISLPPTRALSSSDLLVVKASCCVPRCCVMDLSFLKKPAETRSNFERSGQSKRFHSCPFPMLECWKVGKLEIRPLGSLSNTSFVIMLHPSYTRINSEAATSCMLDTVPISETLCGLALNLSLRYTKTWFHREPHSTSLL